MARSTLASLTRGHVFPSIALDLSLEWVREYTQSVEDAAIGRLGGDFVPPMALAALSIRALLEHAGLPPGAVHVGQELSFHRPVRAGSRLRAAAEIVSRGERQGWVLMGVQMQVQDEGSEPVMTGRATVTFPAAPAE